MRSKNILSIIAFITAFAFSSAFAFLFIDRSPTKNSLAALKVRNVECRQDAETKNAIENLLRQDVRNGQERFWRIYDSNNPSAKSYYERYTDSVEHYSDDSGSISYSHLPRDFQLKWNEHMRAWRDYSNYLNKVKNSSQSLDEDFYNKQKEYDVDINLTYYDVLLVGRTYCVDVSEYLNQ